MLTRVLSTLLVLVLAGHGDAWASAAAERPPAFTVRITSPLGRTGQPERIRIVAQIRGPEDLQIEPVRFFVDSELVGEDRDGPPYAIEWTDANPFEPTEIVVEVRAADAVARGRGGGAGFVRPRGLA